MSSNITLDAVSSSTNLWNSNDGFNYNALDPTQFKISFSKIPHYSFFAQQVSIPSVNLPLAEYTSRMLKHQNIGEKLEFSNLNMTFILDTELKNYIEVLKWMKNLSVTGQIVSERESTAVLLINNAIEIQFVNIWPTSLGEVTFMSTPNVIEYVLCESVWNFDYFNIKGINGDEINLV